MIATANESAVPAMKAIEIENSETRKEIYSRGMNVLREVLGVVDSETLFISCTAGIFLKK